MLEESGTLTQIIGETNSSKAFPMPKLNFGHDSFHFLSNSTDYAISVGFEMAGCEPKFEITYNNGNETKSFIFKPSHRGHGALNEYLAYQVNMLFSFYRVPPVIPIQIPLSRINALLSKKSISQNQKFLKCNMDFAPDEIQDWIQVPAATAGIAVSDNWSAGTEMMVVGTLQLKVPGIAQRGEVVRFLDKTLTPPSDDSNITEGMNSLYWWWRRSHSLLFPKAPSIFSQRERDSRALFDYLIGNLDRFNNDHVISLQSQSETKIFFSEAQTTNGTNNNNINNRLLVYIDHNLVENGVSAFDLKEWTENCRFYHTPVKRISSLLSHSIPSTTLLYVLNTNELLRMWLTSQHGNVTIPRDQLFAVRYINRRAKRVMMRVNECIKLYGFDHVFVEH